MRSTPYSFAKPAAPATQPTLNKQSYNSSLVRDLGEEISRPSADTPPPVKEPVTEPVKPDTTAGAPAADAAPETKGTATLQDDFKSFKQKLATEGEAAIKDPKRAAATTLKTLNFIRTVAYPFIMKWAVFEAQEKAALDGVLAKVFAAENSKTTEGRENVIADFTVFERRVWDKWNGLEAHKKTIAWTPEEINFLVEVGHEKMMDMKFFRMLMGNEFLLGILFIEGRRIAPVVTARMGMGFIDIPSFFL